MCVTYYILPDLTMFTEPLHTTLHFATSYSQITTTHIILNKCDNMKESNIQSI